MNSTCRYQDFLEPENFEISVVWDELNLEISGFSGPRKFTLRYQ